MIPNKRMQFGGKKGDWNEIFAKKSLRTISRSQRCAYKSGKLNVNELARVCDLSRTTVYKYIELSEA